MRFIDYKCEECKSITEIVFTGDNSTHIKCSKCGSKNMVKVFSPVGFKSSSDGDNYSGSSSSCSSCTSGNCNACSAGR